MARFILTLKATKNMGNDYYSFTFLKPNGFQFTEGQYGVFLHVDKEIEGRKMRAFSFASINHSHTVVIGTKITSEPSDFKQKMLDLVPGDTMTVDGPMGNFILDQSKHAVLIAGGIGITPILSIASSIDSPVFESVLIYSEHNGCYPFKDVLETTELSNVIYVSGVEDTKHQITETFEVYQNDAVYYISGSPGFVNGIQEQLVALGVDPSNIKYDRFTGY